MSCLRSVRKYPVADTRTGCHTQNLGPVPYGLKLRLRSLFSSNLGPPTVQSLHPLDVGGRVSDVQTSPPTPTQGQGRQSGTHRPVNDSPPFDYVKTGRSCPHRWTSSTGTFQGVCPPKLLPFTGGRQDVRLQGLPPHSSRPGRTPVLPPRRAGERNRDPTGRSGTRKCRRRGQSNIDVGVKGKYSCGRYPGPEGRFLGQT